MSLRAVDLFCGCGGFSLGLRRAGIEVVGSWDHWQPAVLTARANLDHPVHLADLLGADVVPAIAALKPDLIVGGPPCQDFSSAGLRDETLGRADLTIRFAEIVAELCPELFLMENVERIATSKALVTAKKLWTGAGYMFESVVLDASLYGVPQQRKRFFLLGVRSGDPLLWAKMLVSQAAAVPMTLRDYFGDSLGVEYYYRHPRSYARRGIFGIDEPSPTIRGVNRPVPDGYPGHAGDAGPISPSLRPLTTAERARIQTFPPDYIWKGSRTQTEQMIGNAVPVALAEAVGRALQAFRVGVGGIAAVETGIAPAAEVEVRQLSLF